MRDALQQDVATRGNSRKLAATQWLVAGEQRVGIVADGYDLRKLRADDGIGFVLAVLGQEDGELGLGGEGGYDGDQSVGGEVGDARDYNTLLVSHTLFISSQQTMRPETMMAGLFRHTCFACTQYGCHDRGENLSLTKIELTMRCCYCIMTAQYKRTVVLVAKNANVDIGNSQWV